jgi:hypothetical protein
LEVFHPAKSLVVGVLYPCLNHALIAQVLELLEQKQPDHQAYRLGWSADQGIKLRELLLKQRPGKLLRQDKQGVFGIQLRQ